MNAWLRLIPVLLACGIYAGLIYRKMTQLQEHGQGISEKSLRFDLARLIADLLILLTFLLSGLYPAWFRLFHDTPLGWYTGAMLLITGTLLVSVFVDLYAKREQLRQKEALGRFFLRQMVSLLQIEFMLALVWGCFLVLEPTETSLLFRIAAAAGILLLIRIILYAARTTKNRSERNT